MPFHDTDTQLDALFSPSGPSVAPTPPEDRPVHPVFGTAATDAELGEFDVLTEDFMDSRLELVRQTDYLSKKYNIPLEGQTHQTIVEAARAIAALSKQHGIPLKVGDSLPGPGGQGLHNYSSYFEDINKLASPGSPSVGGGYSYRGKDPYPNEAVVDRNAPEELLRELDRYEGAAPPKSLTSGAGPEPPPTIPLSAFGGPRPPLPTTSLPLPLGVPSPQEEAIIPNPLSADVLTVGLGAGARLGINLGKALTRQAGRILTKIEGQLIGSVEREIAEEGTAFFRKGTVKPAQRYLNKKGNVVEVPEGIYE